MTNRDRKGEDMNRNKKIFALGFFDGVHSGHQVLLAACCRMAREAGIGTAAITFAQHPQSLFTREPPRLISTAEDRCRLLRQFGIETIFTYPVNEAVMGMPWEDFLKELVRCHGAAGFVCGHDFRFGHKGEGDGEKLRQFCAQRGLPCVIVGEQTVDGIRVSSTHIRSLLEKGDMEGARRFLGHPYTVSGTVMSGRHIGRTIGVPTANLWLEEQLLIPRLGVYACTCAIDGKKYAAVTNVGTRPTVGGHRVTVEPWILDFDGDLYGRTLTLEFYKFLRPEQKFPSLEALRAEIRKNAGQTRKIFGEI